MNPQLVLTVIGAINVIMGMVQGMDFPIKVKPDAWAAIIADMFTR